MKKNKVLPYILILPAVVIMAVFVLYPIIVTFFYSLRKMKLTAPKDTAFIGFDNYIYTLKSFAKCFAIESPIPCEEPVINIFFLFIIYIRYKA